MSFHRYGKPPGHGADSSRAWHTWELEVTVELQTFLYSVIAFTILAGFRAYQKMGNAYLNPDAKTRNHRRGEDEFFRWLVLIAIIIVLVFAWYA
jgi:hypothetical protein